VKLEWGGDVDLGDGEVQKEHEKYLEQISLIKGIVRNANAPDERAPIVSDLKSIKRSLDKQLCFAPEGTVVVVVVYMCMCAWSGAGPLLIGLPH